MCVCYGVKQFFYDLNTLPWLELESYVFWVIEWVKIVRLEWLYIDDLNTLYWSNDVLIEFALYADNNIFCVISRVDTRRVDVLCTVSYFVTWLVFRDL